ncbi:MAG: GtrA family protein [Christensenellales bacterium]
MSELKDVVILIPAYKPSFRMIELIKKLQSYAFLAIVVVDDGSGAEYAPVFTQAAALGCVVLRHSVNMGKGRAMKTGFNHCLLAFSGSAGVVTADADGQHMVEDIANVANAMLEKENALIIGSRRFGSEVPLRSRFGNTVTRWIFSFATGKKIHDTQTGLRGYPQSILDEVMLLSGERYEYEMNILLSLKPFGIPAYEVIIETVYLDNNQESHFHVLRDSFRIYALIFKFIFASLLSFILDYGIYAFMISSVTDSLLISTLSARLISSVVNYLMNRTLVFKAQKISKWQSIIKYYLLAVVVYAGSLGLLLLLYNVLGINKLLAKPIADIVMYLLSFVLQRDFVFKPTARA